MGQIEGSCARFQRWVISVMGQCNFNSAVAFTNALIFRYHRTLCRFWRFTAEMVCFDILKLENGEKRLKIAQMAGNCLK